MMRTGAPWAWEIAAACAAGLGLAAPPAQAAGGHHAVDDAVLLEPGQCLVELWAERDTGPAPRRLLHLGPACRVGAVELGLNVDGTRRDGAAGSTLAGPQLKWATAPGTEFSLGLVLAANWVKQGEGTARRMRYQGASVVLPVTWQMSPQWAAHLNLGRDLRPGRAGDKRAGVALEWSPQEACSFVAEHFRDTGANHARLGARWNLTPDVSLDLSRARTVGAPQPAWWTLGVNVAFMR